MNTPLVIDAAAAVDLLLNTAAGASLWPKLPRPAVEWVPEIYYAEVAAVLRRGELNGHIPPERVDVAIARLLAAPVRRVQVKPLLPEAWGLRHNVTVADALYVVLARHLGAALATTDTRLAKAPGLGVEVIHP